MRPAGLLAIALALAAGTARAEEPPPREVAVSVHRLQAASSSGGDAEERLAFGLRAGLDLRPLVLPAPWLLRAELLWLHDGTSAGTRAVTVDTSLDTVALPLLAGFELAGTSRPWRLGPYLTAGPTVVRTGIDYRIDDPAAPGSGGDRSVASWDVGLLYGGGVRLARGLGDVGLSARLELLGLRRGVADDLAFGAALGLLL